MERLNARRSQEETSSPQRDKQIVSKKICKEKVHVLCMCPTHLEGCEGVKWDLLYWDLKYQNINCKKIWKSDFSC